MNLAKCAVLGICKNAMSEIFATWNVRDVWRTSKCAHLLSTSLIGWGLLNDFKIFVERRNVIFKMGWVSDWGPVCLVNYDSFGVSPIPSDSDYHVSHSNLLGLLTAVEGFQPLGSHYWFHYLSFDKG